jgi:hypothetical protein
MLAKIIGRGKKRASPKPRSVSTLKKNKPQGTHNSSTHIITTNDFEPQRLADTEGSTKRERNQPAPSPIFVPGITNMQQLTATVEQVVIHSPRCGTIASVAFILWRVKQAANKLCWLAAMCKYNTQGSYSYNHHSGQRGSTIDH